MSNAKFVLQLFKYYSPLKTECNWFEIGWYLLTYWLEDGMSILNDDKLRFTTMHYITYRLENNEMEVSNLLNDAIVQI